MYIQLILNNIKLNINLNRFDNTLILTKPSFVLKLSSFFNKILVDILSSGIAIFIYILSYN